MVIKRSRWGILGLVGSQRQATQFPMEMRGTGAAALDLSAGSSTSIIVDDSSCETPPQPIT
jgi:hypothetical protein